MKLTPPGAADVGKVIGQPTATTPVIGVPNLTQPTGKKPQKSVIGAA